MKPYLNLLKYIDAQVRAKIQPLIGTSKAGEIVGEGKGGDKTKYIDKVAEDIVFNILKEREIPCIVISEERGSTKILGGGSEIYFILDGVDGTNNALRGIPFFAFSLAVADAPWLSHVHTSLVSDIRLGDVYTAEKDKGAYVNDHPISPSRIAKLSEALLVINLSPSKKIPRKIIRLVKQARHARHFGANALEICYIASGKLDGYIDLRGRLRVTDLAAAYLILKEAGGFIIDKKGKNLDSRADSPRRRVAFIACGNNKLLKKLRPTLP